jgi:hypothetical protein
MISGWKRGHGSGFPPVESGDLARADETLQAFVAEAGPLLPAYVP